MSVKGAVIEFDFAAADGAGLLFSTTEKLLRDLDVTVLDKRTEARFLEGTDYQEGLSKLFAYVKTKKTAAKAARDLAAAFSTALDEAVPRAVTPAFKNFINALAAHDVRVVIATRADTEVVAAAFRPLLSGNTVLYHEPSQTYGSVRHGAWRLACAANGLAPSSSTVVVTGSGIGVKSALFAGIPVIAVASGHAAYQDFSGADDVVGELNAPAARKVLNLLKVC